MFDRATAFVVGLLMVAVAVAMGLGL